MSKEFEITIRRSVATKLVDLENRISQLKNIQMKILMNKNISKNKEQISIALKTKIRDLEGKVHEYSRFLDLKDLPEEMKAFGRPRQLSL